MYKKSIFWFREDLRINDNAGLWNALKESENVLCIYIFNKNEIDNIGFNNKRHQFIWNSVQQLKLSLKMIHSDLFLFHDTPEEIFPQIIKQYQIDAVFTNETYTLHQRQNEFNVQKELSQKNIPFFSIKDSCIFSKNELLDKNETPYISLSKYSKAWLNKVSPDYYQFFNISDLSSRLQHFKQAVNLHPLEIKIHNNRQPSDFKQLGASPEYASRILDNFLTNKVSNYSDISSLPIEGCVSYLSPYLNQGLLSIRQALSFALKHGENHPDSKDGCNSWINQLILRDFYSNISYHFPRTLYEPFLSRFEGFHWENNMEYFHKWCIGMTGYPLVDAAMRHFNQFGYMHQNLRKLTSSFFTKHLLIDYRLGEKYFAEKSIDFHPIFNNAGWQWAASTGAESQSFFKIINPISFSEKFDQEAKFIKKYVPELRLVDSKYLHDPYKYRTELLTFGIRLGTDYPEPIVENQAARQKAIWKFEKFSKI